MSEQKRHEFQFLLVRSFCMVCGNYGRCAVAYGYDGRELHIGVDCGCLERDLKQRQRVIGSPDMAYC